MKAMSSAEGGGSGRIQNGKVGSLKRLPGWGVRATGKRRVCV
jgi:hypothetical protein